MKETTTHCDYCDNPLGVKCDRTAPSAVRAKLHGVWVCSIFILRRKPDIQNSGLSFRFFCSEECKIKFLDQGESCDEEKTHKTKDEKKEGSS